METPLITSAITAGTTLYVLRRQDSQTQTRLSAAVCLGTYYAMSQTSEESKTTKHVDIDASTNCSY